MAFVVDGNGDGWFVTVAIMDRGEEKATRIYELRAADHAEAVTQATTVITNLKLVSQVEVLGYNIQQRFYNNAIIIPAAGQLQEQARVAYRIENSSNYETFDIPAPVSGLFLQNNGAASEIVDVADNDLNTYANMFKSTGICFISDGESLEQISRGERVSSRKGMRRGR